MKYLICVFSFLAVCCLASVQTGPGLLAAEAQIKEEFKKEIPLEPGGSVILENMLGDVELSGGDGNLVEIQAVKQIRGRLSSGSDWGVDQKWLKEIKIKIEQSGNQVEIKTEIPTNKTFWDYFDDLSLRRPAMIVDYKVKIPRRTNVNVKTVSGKLVIKDLEGEVEAHVVNGGIEMKEVSGALKAGTVNGSIDIDLRQDAGIKDMELTTVNGSISLGLPPSAAAEVDLSTVIGTINLEFPVTVQEDVSGKNIRGKIGSGGPSIRLNTINGDIKVKK
jgi:hypothetical protein